MKKLIFITIFLLVQAASAQQKIVPWTWQKSDCQTCGVKFQLVGDINANQDMDKKEKFIRFMMSLEPSSKMALDAYDLDATARTMTFLYALSSEKETILKIYNSDPQEYNLLAHIAVGILGQESRFFAHWRYFIKRNSQLAIKEIKEFKALIKDKDAIANSKGPTQIKDVPDRISQHYNIVEADLWNPKFAAVSTMGFLIEALRELKQRAKNNNLTMINDKTYVDYLPYLYFGGAQKLVNRTATPETNIYVKNMKKFMKKVSVSEVVK
ncbi:MAG: hypothetical protein H7235_01235 [Bdellovibrionaceae bacterium]|nr:hypothetical protein [Pseudobdellovibrionaceae bacterium]